MGFYKALAIFFTVLFISENIALAHEDDVAILPLKMQEGSFTSHFKDFARKFLRGSNLHHLATREERALGEKALFQSSGITGSSSNRLFPHTRKNIHFPNHHVLSASSSNMHITRERLTQNNKKPEDIFMDYSGHQISCTSTDSQADLPIQNKRRIQSVDGEQVQKTTVDKKNFSVSEDKNSIPDSFFSLSSDSDIAGMDYTPAHKNPPSHNK